MSSRRLTLGVAILGTLALAVGAIGVAGAAKKAKTKTKTFSSKSISVPIRDTNDPDGSNRGNVAIGQVNVKKNARVKDINVSIRADHTAITDPELTLLSPGGKRAKFYDDPEGDYLSYFDFGSGSNSCSGSKTTFDDEASGEIADALDGHVGTFKPEGAPLSELNGSQMRGAWYLLVDDVIHGDEGELGCVDLKIKYKQKKRK